MTISNSLLTIEEDNPVIGYHNDNLKTLSFGLRAQGAICLALTSVDMGPVTCNYPDSDYQACPDPGLPAALAILNQHSTIPGRS